MDKDRVPLSWIVGGEDVILEIQCIAHNTILRPIVGFSLNDRLGQAIFVDNTYIEYQHKNCTIDAGRKFIASFEFRLPILPPGDYSISAAVADGTQESHVQLHWKHDALIVKVHSSSVCFGLIGVPMRSISLKTV